MKSRLIQTLSIMLAAILQLAPMIRQLVPATQGLAPNAWAMILKIGVGSLALVGFDAVSRASSISISPANATAGSSYSGTVTYSGGHASSVSSMQVQTNGVYTCTVGASIPIGDGLSMIYNSKNTATVSGTPTVSSNLTITVKVWDGGCGSGHSDTHSTTLVIAGSGTTTNVAQIVASPQNVIAQIGTDVQLSGGASGYPIPQYQWWQGFTPIAGATNSILSLTNVQLTSAGVYTMTASNVANAGQTFSTLPKANCYLSVCLTAGTNFTALNYTNLAPAGVALTLSSYVTNVAGTVNTYQWSQNGTSLPGATSTTYTIAAANVKPSVGGVYGIAFTGTNAGVQVIPQTPVTAYYESYWAFGYLPVFTNSLPAATNVASGGNVTFSLSVGGSLNIYDVTGTAYSTSSVPCVFWYQNATNLVASQIYTNNPTTSATYSNTFVNASLTLNNVTSATNGNYTVVVTNFWGSITSTPVALTVSGGGKQTPLAQTPMAGAAITYGQTLGGSSLSGAFTNAAGAAVAGALAFALPGITPLAGSTNVSVVFTPTDTVTYAGVTNTIAVTVNKATPVLTAPAATAIAHGQPFSASTLIGGAATNSFNQAAVAGGFAFTSLGGVPAAGVTNAAVTFTPSDAADYNAAATTASVSVTNAPAVSITISKPAPGSVGLGGVTFPNRTYYVQMATNLALPSPWISILTNTADSGGNINWQTNATGAPGAFYQLFFP